MSDVALFVVADEKAAFGENVFSSLHGLAEDTQPLFSQQRSAAKMPTDHKTSDQDPQLLAQRIQHLEERNSLLEKVIDLYPHGLVVIDKNLNVILCNRSQRKLLEYPESLFEHQNPTLRELFHFNAARGEYGPGDVNVIVSNKLDLVSQRQEHCFERQRPNGRFIKIQGLPLEGGGFLTSYTDVTADHEHIRQIAELALVDEQTGALSRRATIDRIALECARSRKGESFALHVVNFENLDALERQHGHVAAGSAMAELSERLRAIVNEVSAVGRLSDNAFVVIQSMLKQTNNVSALALRISRRTKQPFASFEGNFQPEFTIGSIIVKDTLESPDNLIELADAKAVATKKFEFSL